MSDEEIRLAGFAALYLEITVVIGAMLAAIVYYDVRTLWRKKLKHMKWYRPRNASGKVIQ